MDHFDGGEPLARMARAGDADLALVQEAGSPPADVPDRIEYEDEVFWSRQLYDRWPLVVKLSDRIRVEPYRQVLPTDELAEDAIGVSGIGTIAAAKVIPRDGEDGFVAVSMYARWRKPHPSTESQWRTGYADASAHRIISDMSTFIGYQDPAKHRILAAGDLNLFYGATGSRLALPERDRTVWQQMHALGLEFLGPQASHGRRTLSPPADVPADTKNVPTGHYGGGGPATAMNQVYYAFASRGFHRSVSVRALSDPAECGPSDQCRLMIEVKAG